MRIAPLASLLLAATLTAQTPPPAQRGVFLEDIDKSVDACTSFFDYANGSWRRANPIPASMQRWSRRWAAGEQSKEQLRAIIDDLSNRHDWPKGSIDQQITDFYGSCMDEKRIDALGVTPIQPYLDDIDAIRNRTALQKVIAQLHGVQVNTPFGLASSPDNHNPADVIARVYASGLGLPDRDYYFSEEKRFVETRERYLDHVAKMFELEVPEVGEKIVEIKSIVREPGDRTKIAVSSRDKAVDPVGACVGIKGSRVQAVVRELRGEKIDIITWTQDPRVFIAEALNPATIEKVGIDEEKKSALVVVADSQLSLAIGKNGQNVRLAARLTGWKIDIISATEYEKEKAERDRDIKAALAEETEAQRQQDEARAAAQQAD